MRWIVGIDLRERSRGAIAFASWIRRQTKAHTFVAAHATPQPQTSLGEPPIDLDALHAEALEVLGRELAASGASDDDFEDRGLIESVAPEDGLTEAMRRNAADGLVVGRRANKVDDAWIRLGRVARRLLRTLPGPVVAVPGDLEAADLARGPVLLTTDLGKTSEAAAEFAKRFARDVGRPLHVAHVVATMERNTIPPKDAWSTPPLATRPGQNESLDEWLAARGLGDATVRREQGNVLERLRHVIETDPPCTVVCGSRSLSAAERIFTSSVASALAGIAPVPVAVVPADWTPPTP